MSDADASGEADLGNTAISAGCFLVASDQLGDAHFRRTVVYLAEHSDDGTLGFIINRPLTLPLGELWTACPEAIADAVIAAEGGPVEPGKGLLLHADASIPATVTMGPGLFVGGDLDALMQRFANGPDHHGPRLFLGHSGWAPGQLAHELAHGAWLVRPGDAAQVVARCLDGEHLWRHLLKSPRPAGHRLPRPSMN